MTIRGRWRGISLNAHVQSDDKSDNTIERFREQLDCFFLEFPRARYVHENCVGDFETKVGQMEDIFKQTLWNGRIKSFKKIKTFQNCNCEDCNILDTWIEDLWIGNRQ